MHQLINEIINGTWLIQKETVDGLLPWLVNYMQGKTEGFPLSTTRNRDSIVAMEFDSKDKIKLTESVYSDGPIPANSIMILPVVGVVTKYDQFCGPVGTQTLIRSLESYDENPNVIAMVLRIDSPGGEGYAARGLAEAIQATDKPVISFIDDLAASAAYWIASASDVIYVNSKLATVGSIGSYAVVTDYTKYFEMKGIKVHEIYANASRDKNLDYRQAIAGKPELVQKKVSEFNDEFLSSVARYRGDNLKSDFDVWGTGRTFWGAEALRLGLVDEIMPFKEMLNDVVINIL